MNKYGSRSFNDLSAYPIFPWVVTDYKNDSIAFEEAKSKGRIYRDFGKATTVFRESDKEEIDNRYSQRLEVIEVEGKEEYKRCFIDWKMFGD